MNIGGARWVRLGRTASLLLAFSGRRYLAHLSRLALERGVLLSDTDADLLGQSEELVAEALAHEVLLDWMGMIQDGVKNPPYTPQAGKRAILGSDRFKAIVMSGLAQQRDHEKRLIDQTTSELSWQLRWSGGIEALMISYRKTGEVPKALQDRPDSPKDVLFYLDCFHALSKFRGSNGFGISPISFSDTSDYALSIGYEKGSNQYFFFLEIISSLDEVFRSAVNNKTDTARPAAKPVQSKIWVPREHASKGR